MPLYHAILNLSRSDLLVSARLSNVCSQFQGAMDRTWDPRDVCVCVCVIGHQGNHNVVQLASGVCPTAATPAADQKQLVPAALDGKATLTFPTPGTVCGWRLVSPLRNL